METDGLTFEYWLAPLDEEDIEARLRTLVARIGEHVERHDFAQRILLGDISIREWPAGEGVGHGRAIVVPFYREHFREMPAIAFYLRELGRKQRLRLAALMLPGGGCIPM